jgi:putative intracellular protease/amidase
MHSNTGTIDFSDSHSQNDHPFRCPPSRPSRARCSVPRRVPSRPHRDLSNEYLSITPGPILDPIRPFGIDLAMHYIADSLEPVRLTAGVTIVPTDTYETCPALDYLWIPGPSPAYQPSAAEIAFVRARYAEVKTVFSVCTGAIVLGASGIADGRRATGNRAVIEMLKAQYPKGAVVGGGPVGGG